MNHACIAAASAESGTDLHKAPWITRCDERGFRRLDVVELGREHGGRRLRLQQVVDPGGSAAVVGVLERNELDAWDRRKNLERRSRDALRVQQMARRVVRHGDVERTALERAGCREQLADIARALRNTRRT